MAALHVRIHGRVQGVGYRAFAARAARRLGLRGWVRNAANGTVEAVVDGTAEDVRSWIDELRRGPSGARVASIDEQPVDRLGDETPAFEIRW